MLMFSVIESTMTSCRMTAMDHNASNATPTFETCLMENVGTGNTNLKGWTNSSKRANVAKFEVESLYLSAATCFMMRWCILS